MYNYEVFKCEEDNVCPEWVEEAAFDGILEVKSDIGWIKLAPEDFCYVRNGCSYRISKL